MKEGSNFKRRTLVKAIAASSLIPILGSNLIGCSDSSDRGISFPEPEPEPTPIAAEFLHGVASGDPLADRVIIWTRATPESEGEVLVVWEVATDAEFTSIVASGEGTTDDSVDYTVKVDVDGLDPATSYYYRFMVGDNTSTVAKTKTAPMGANAEAAFAVVSCANYPAGFFNAYREVANEDVDAVLHLGDYIYEYAMGGYATERAEEFGRVPEPVHEILNLDDYRMRYAQYHSDVDLQAAHAAHPFIVVWDDHEIANNTWSDGAENHDPETEGSFTERKAAAIQAWYEWLPVRPPNDVREIIYRKLPYGDLVDLLMLDTRVIARDEQNTYLDFVNGGIIDVDATRAAINDSNRALMGSEQMGWLKGHLTSSTARWQVLGQQVMMARMHLPSSIMEALDPSIAGDDAVEKGIAAILASLAAKSKAPEDRTPEEQALLDSAIPILLDFWDGYNAEREELLNHALQVGSKIVTLTGDSHNSWGSQLTTDNGDIAGVEFAGTSVTSPGWEEILPVDLASSLPSLVAPLIDDLMYLEPLHRGYLKVRFTMEAVTASWLHISNVDSTTYTVLDDLFRESTVSIEDMILT